MPEDPVGQVAAIRPARHAEPIRIGQTFRYQRLDAGEDVAHGPVSPVPVVGVVERLAITFRSARVAIEDAHPGRSEDLELPYQRPAVQGVRATMDLDHEWMRPVPRWHQPALDVAAVHLEVALLRLDEADVVQDVGVERCQPPRDRQRAD